MADIERITREIHILRLVRHPNIIQLYEIIDTPTKIYLVMEYASNGELFEYITKNTKLNEQEACKFFQQIVSGVEYLQRLKIVHRDLKPKNMLLDYENNVKIVDFSLSNIYKPGQLLNTSCGSPCYAAPEMIAGKHYDPSEVDVWSIGIVLFFMICGFLPFEDSNTTKLYAKILNGNFEIPEFVSNEAKELIKKILIVDPEKRITISQVKTHLWFKKINQEWSNGTLLGYESIHVDKNIISSLKNYNIDTEVALNDIKNNKYNNLTTSYYLALQKNWRNQGKKSELLETIESPFISPSNFEFIKTILSHSKKLKKNPVPDEFSYIETLNSKPKKIHHGRGVSLQLPKIPNHYTSLKSSKKLISTQTKKKSIKNLNNLSPYFYDFFASNKGSTRTDDFCMTFDDRKKNRISRDFKLTPRSLKKEELFLHKKFYLK